MKAEELFKNLGYKKEIEWNGDISYEPTREQEWCGGIVFILEEKRCNLVEGIWNYASCEVDLLKAINKQIEELGWGKEEENEEENE